MKFKVVYINAKGQYKRQMVSAASARLARMKFEAMYENRYGYAPVVHNVCPWEG